LVGYWEPHGDDSDDDDELGMMGDGLEDEEESEDELKVGGDGMPKKRIEGLDDIENFDDDDDGDDDDDDDDDEIDLEDGDDDEAPPLIAKPKALPAGASTNKQKPGQANKSVPITIQSGKPQGNSPAATKPDGKGKGKVAPKSAPEGSSVGQKRKANGDAAGAPEVKQAKSTPPTAAKGVAGGDAAGDAKFQLDLTDYLTKHGKTSMSELGSKVKKPAGVAKKLQAFMKDRTQLFKIENGHVELISK